MVRHLRLGTEGESTKRPLALSPLTLQLSFQRDYFSFARDSARILGDSLALCVANLSLGALPLGLQSLERKSGDMIVFQDP